MSASLPFGDDDYDTSYRTGSASGGRVHPLQNGASNPESSKVPVDFDSFSSDAEKLSAILKCADVEQHKHKLSATYFHFRRYAILIPILVMSLFIAVGGFVAASDIMKPTQRIHDSTMQEFLTILVATFGFMVLILTILGNGLNYHSRVAFHRAAASDLEGLCDKVRLYRMERAMDERAREENEELRELFPEDDDSTESDSSDSDSELTPRVNQHNGAIIPHAGNNALMVKKQVKATKKVQKRRERLTKTLVKQKVHQAREEQELSKDVITFYGYHTELHQINVGCRSDVPPAISKFFHVMENRVELMSLSRLGVEEDSRMRKNQIVRLCAHEIYNEVSNHWAFPLLTPGVDHTVEGALKRVGQLLNMNYRAQRRCKMIPCCPYIPLCCKKRNTNNVFAIINEGIDQRELDMMQAERTEMVRMEKEKRARRMAGPEGVLEMRDTIYEDGGNLIGGGGGGRTRPKLQRRQSMEPAGIRSSGTGPSNNGYGNGGSGVGGRGGSRSIGGRSLKNFLDTNSKAQSRQTRQSQDPEGESWKDMTTEASFTQSGASVPTEASFSVRGGYAGHHFNGSGALGNNGDYSEDDMITEEDETYQGSFMSYTEGGDYTEEGDYMDDVGDYTDEDEEEGNVGKKKKKKKKKSKKKKKKKSKSKKKVVSESEEEEEEEEGTYAEESYAEYSEYSDGYTNEDSYT
eukprot:CAMPEP_0183715508 /NCGR_PEP_ID=MMETSP0737-20130205/9690_1 /TAXON_ID=385413 /ORGANISM="Thalassiosira miniscula, Strain CCMP1093" /LENGTH=690 /DNA_ID=CAMNT_0025944603 /DNA_START=238 /DNA_END=2306 /DNA_ORIENTATION=-